MYNYCKEVVHQQLSKPHRSASKIWRMTNTPELSPPPRQSRRLGAGRIMALPSSCNNCLAIVPRPSLRHPLQVPIVAAESSDFLLGLMLFAPSCPSADTRACGRGDPRLLDGAATYQTFYISQTGTNDSLSAPSPFEVAAARRPSQLFLLSPSKHPPFDMLHAHYLCPI